MAEMPEKIWAGALLHYGHLAHGIWEEWDDTTAQEEESAYIRADLYEALQKEVVALRERFTPKPIDDVPPMVWHLTWWFDKYLPIRVLSKGCRQLYGHDLFCHHEPFDVLPMPPTPSNSNDEVKGS